VSESLEDVIFAMQSTGILVPPTVDEHSDSGDEPSQLLWQITQDMTEHLMPGFMESIIPLPPVTAVRSTWSPTIAATSAEWKNSMSVWREKAPVAKVTRNAAALNGAYRILYDPLVTDCFFLPFFAAVRVLLRLSYLFISIRPPGPSSGRGCCHREEDFQT
jgi:hypothetical protein